MTKIFITNHRETEYKPKRSLLNSFFCLAHDLYILPVDSLYTNKYILISSTLGKKTKWLISNPFYNTIRVLTLPVWYLVYNYYDRLVAGEFPFSFLNKEIIK